MLFLGEENGFQAHTDTFLGGFNIVGLPAGGVPGGFGCWIVTLDLDVNPNFPFMIAGSDLDITDGSAPNFSGVGLVDFGYTYGLLTPFNNAAGGFGPIITVDDYNALPDHRSGRRRRDGSVRSARAAGRRSTERTSRRLRPGQQQHDLRAALDGRLRQPRWSYGLPE